MKAKIEREVFTSSMEIIQRRGLTGNKAKRISQQKLEEDRIGMDNTLERTETAVIILFMMMHD